MSPHLLVYALYTARHFKLNRDTAAIQEIPAMIIKTLALFLILNPAQKHQDPAPY